MQIECIIKRPEGSEVEVGSKTYWFLPNADGAHVCEVEDAAHIAVLLGITEGYRELGAPVVAADVQPDPEPDLIVPDALSNRELTRWAQQQGINPKSRESIEAYALGHGFTEVDKSQSIPALLRLLMNAEQAVES